MLYNFIAFSAAVATGAADADCQAYYFKINGVCTGVQQIPNAQGCGVADGGISSHPLSVDKAFCQEFGTARVPADQQDLMRSWGNLGKNGAANYAGEVDDPTIPSGCITHSNQNLYQWNNAANGAVSKWWRVVCMTETLPAPRTFTKCQQVVPDRAMSIKNGADSTAVQLCKVINGNVMSPMWGNGKNSDCGTDAALITASTDSVDDCRMLCDAHPLCLAWMLYDQNRMPAPFTQDNKGCYLYEAGTKDQLVPDRTLGGEEVAAGACFPDDVQPTTPAGFTNAGQGWCQDAQGHGFRHYRIEQPDITEAECLAECHGMPECGSINYLPASKICIVDVDHAVSPAGATAPLWTMVAGGQGMHPVTSVESSPDTVCYSKDQGHARGGGLDACDDSEQAGFGINLNILSATSIFPTTWDPSTLIHGGTIPEGLGWPVSTIAECKALCQAEPRCKAWASDMPIQDPTWHPQAFCWLYDSDDFEAHIISSGKWMMGVNCAHDGTVTIPVEECILSNIGPNRCAQRSMKGLGRLSPAEISLEENFTGTFEDCVAHTESLESQGAGYMIYTPPVGAMAGTCTTFVVRVCPDGQTGPGFCPAAMPPTEPPTTCDCRQTTATYNEGARCMGPHQTSIGYRKTANWCCSDYGCSKGYKWVNPADDICHDDTFVGTCMFNFIQNGGCNMATADDDTLMASVDDRCFDCDHIGELVDQECMGAQTPLHILGDMINDARRLSGTPLPAGDAELEKINKRIAKIRTLLKQKKLAAKAALGRPVIG